MVFRFRVRRNWRVTARKGKGEINLGYTDRWWKKSSYRRRNSK